MKRTALLVLLVFSSNTVFAATYDAECLNAKGKFKTCKVSTEEGRLKISFKSKYDQEGNVDIPGKNIKALMSGEYARRRVGEAIGTAILSLGIGIFLMFSKKKRDQVGIEYVEGDVTSKKVAAQPSKILMVQVKKKYGLALKADLKALSGKDIQEEVASK